MDETRTKTYLVTRHPGARDWVTKQGYCVDESIDHLDNSKLNKIGCGDTVIGTLPVQLAAKVCDQGARYLHLSLDLPPGTRSQELTAEQMMEYGARIQRCLISLCPQETRNPIVPNTDIDDKYKSDNLVLLVGGNPLPNAVAAKLLTKPDSHVFLAHSSGTMTIAENLVAWLQDFVDDNNISLIDLGDRESDPSEIFNKIAKTINAERPGGTWGLHYTGGTKAMAVHSHRAFQNGHENNITFSYLNPRNLNLVIDAESHGTHGNTEEIPVRNTRITLEDLLNLHGVTIQNQSIRQDPIFPRSADQLLSIYSCKKTRDAWEKWLAEEAYNKMLTWKSKGFEPVRAADSPDHFILKPLYPGGLLGSCGLKAVQLNWPGGDQLSEFAETLKEELSQVNNEFAETLKEELSLLCHTKSFCKWLMGQWLESAVLGAFKALATNEFSDLHDMAMNIDTQELSGKPNFQFDVVAIRGYQLFACSCTTDTGSHIKQKLFEAQLRARQLGGDEARVALICPHQNPDRLKKEIQQTMGVDSKVEVFGCRDLPNLKDKLKEWIKNN